MAHGRAAVGRLSPRGKASVIAGTGVLAVLLVTATTSIIDTTDAPGARSSAAETARDQAARDQAARDQAAREQAAQRADRSGRTGASSSTPTAAPTATDVTPGAVAAAPAVPAPALVAPTAPAVTPAWVSPMPGVALSSCYGSRWGGVHQGIDFAGDAGTTIVAVGAGTVLDAGWLYSGYGISVVIDHGNGYLSHYAHASQVLVTAGQTVTAGQPIAIEGSTGDATGPHLHFEIHQGLWNQIDPAPWLRERGIPIGC